MQFLTSCAISCITAATVLFSGCTTQSEYRPIAEEERIHGYGAPLTMGYQAFIKITPLARRAAFSTRSIGSNKAGLHFA